MAGVGSEPTIGVITALSKEYAAVRAMLDGPVDISRGDRSRRKYVSGSMRARIYVFAGTNGRGQEQYRRRDDPGSGR
jgi:hypothetical protein